MVSRGRHETVTNKYKTTSKLYSRHIKCDSSKTSADYIDGKRTNINANCYKFAECVSQQTLLKPGIRLVCILQLQMDVTTHKTATKKGAKSKRYSFHEYIVIMPCRTFSSLDQSTRIQVYRTTNIQIVHPLTSTVRTQYCTVM